MQRGDQAGRHGFGVVYGEGGPADAVPQGAGGGRAGPQLPALTAQLPVAVLGRGVLGAAQVEVGERRL
jgi:hypothetical protein